MASTLSNVISFLSPSTAPPSSARAPPVHVSFPFSSKPRSCFVPLAASSDDQYSGELAAVINPSLAYANRLFYKGHHVQIVVDDNESDERLVNRFRRTVLRAGIIQECKRRRYFENKQDEKKRKHREAAKRNRRRRQPPNFNLQKNEESQTTKKNDDDDDNWDLPEEDVPYLA